MAAVLVVLWEWGPNSKVVGHLKLAWRRTPPSLKGTA